MYQISRIIEPNKLRLIWQAVNGPDRNKYVVAELVRAGPNVSLYYNYNSVDFLSAIRAGFLGHPAFDYRVPVHHGNVLEIFLKRVPPRNRSDFWLFLQKNGLSNHGYISDFALLGYSRARLPGDGFSLEIDFSIEISPFEFFTEISGFRYYQGMHLEMETLLGQLVTLMHEPDNPVDATAIEVVVGGTKLGYIPRTQTAEFHNWISSMPLGVWIDRIEGTPARPLVALFVKVGGFGSPLLALN